MKDTKKLQRFEWILLGIIIICLLFMWLGDVVRIINWKIPNEIREGANIALVDAFIEGNNTFRSLRTSNGLPNVYYMYPMLNNLLGAGIVKISCLPAGLVLLLLNFFYTLASSLMIATIVGHYTNKSKYFMLLAFLMSHYCGWRYSNVSAFPDMLAVLFILIIMYVCTVRTELIRNRELLLLSVLTVLCFYTKQYTLVVGLPVIIYLWWKVGHKKAIFYFGATAILGLGSAVIIHIAMPLYFMETLLLVGNSADNSFHWMITQFIKMGKLFFPWFLLILIWTIYRIKRKEETDYIWIYFFSVAAALLYLGQNTGAHMSYFLQLWLPAVIILGMRALDWILKEVEKKHSNKMLILIGLKAFMVLFALFPFLYLHTPQLTTQQKRNWDKVYEISDNSTNLLATSQNANYQVLQQEYMYDYGQNQYILREETIEYFGKLEQSETVQKIFPQILEFREMHKDYRQVILDTLENQQYDVLLLVDDFGFTRDWEEFNRVKKEKYYLSEEIELETGVWKWSVGVWKSK